jgi:hypothetical protein
MKKHIIIGFGIIFSFVSGFGDAGWNNGEDLNPGW